MSFIDIAIAGVLSVSAAIGVFRGFVRETLSLLTWVLAGFSGWLFADTVAGFLQDSIPEPTVRFSAAFLLVFGIIYIAGSLITWLVHGFFTRRPVLKLTNTLLGVALGLARGVVIVAVLFLLAGLTAVPRSDGWRRSLLVPYFQDVAVYLADFLPKDIARHIHYD